MGVPVFRIRFVIGLFVQIGLLGLVIAPALGQELNDDRVEVNITARAGLRYDVVRFTAKMGQAVQVKLINGDDMAHNLVFTKPGQRLVVATAALALGTDGEAKNWVPDHDAVLWSTPVLPPGERHVVQFTAPLERGIYPYVCTFPGHGFVMYGVMYVGVSMPELAKDQNIPELARQGKKAQKQFHAWGHKRPLIYRIFMPDASPAAIAVGLEHGQNYCWDAGQCRLRYAWYGGFVDPWPVWKGNGNGLARVLGTRYWEAKSALPLQIGEVESVASFKGYRKVNGHPEFHYEVNGVDIYELIEPLHTGLGIRRSFRIPNNTGLVRLAVDSTDGVVATYSAGKLKEGILELRDKQAREFTVTHQLAN